LVTIALPARAHKASDSYLSLKLDGALVEGQWDIALRDLELAVGLDANGDGEITWGELRAKHQDIAAYAFARLAIVADSADCSKAIREHLIDDHSDGAYAVLRFVAKCPAPPVKLAIDYRLLFDLDPQHKGLLRVEHEGRTQTAILEPERSQARLTLGEASWLATFVEMFRQGAWHIWIGFDHVLFLLSLLLPAVLVPRERRWEAVPAFGPAFWDVFKIVTSFTIAHSITLALAALEIVTLPSRAVESAIAVSVVLAALNNVRPVLHRSRWAVAFVFGLIHGFGFAAVLTDLGLPPNALLVALAAFNLGVEAGQLAIVAVFLPIAYAVRHTWLYRRAVLVGGSALIVLLAGAWLVERAFEVKLLS
jgi:hypothetical protein